MINSFNLYNYLSESFLDYPDNKSLCLIFYMPGCDRKCPGCQNMDLQKFEDYKNVAIINDLLYDICLKSKTNKLCLQGGDPLYEKNLEITKYLLKDLGNKLDICIYTGADISEVKSLNLENFKFIKCGKFDSSKFIGSKKTDTYLQLASSNQELYDKDLNLISKDGIYYF